MIILNYVTNRAKNLFESLDQRIVTYSSDFCMSFGLLFWASAFFTAIEEVIRGHSEFASVLGVFLALIACLWGFGYIVLGGIIIYLHIIVERSKCL